jgi:hypothetical protein
MAERYYYSNRENVDMIKTQDACDGNAHAAAIEVCTGPGLGPTRPGPHRYKTVIKRKIEHFRLSRVILFRKEKIIRKSARRMLVPQSDSGNKSHRPHFLRDFRSCPSQWDTNSQTWHPVLLYSSSNAKINSDVLERR